ncbi:MAG: hypothetical protein DRJ41_03750 [Thermoprotei archaeon]|nr:MAG: hypothetical protein DRJ41_03750 [Thermoprotei archaeon]
MKKKGDRLLPGLIELGLILILIGVALIATALLVYVILGLIKEKRNIRGGSVIIIGPLPIMMASDKEVAKMALLFTVIVLLFSLMITLMMYYS